MIKAIFLKTRSDAYGKTKEPIKIPIINEGTNKAVRQITY